MGTIIQIKIKQINIISFEKEVAILIKLQTRRSNQCTGTTIYKIKQININETDADQTIR